MKDDKITIRGIDPELHEQALKLKDKLSTPTIRVKVGQVYNEALILRLNKEV